jgi:hypothetical protein
VPACGNFCGRFSPPGPLTTSSCGIHSRKMPMVDLSPNFSDGYVGRSGLHTSVTSRAATFLVFHRSAWARGKHPLTGRFQPVTSPNE